MSHVPQGVLSVWKPSFNLKKVLKNAYSPTCHWHSDSNKLLQLWWASKVQWRPCRRQKKACKPPERYSIPNFFFYSAHLWVQKGVLKCLQNVGGTCNELSTCDYTQWTIYMRPHTWRAHGCGCHIMHETRLNCVSRACDWMWLWYTQVLKRRDLRRHTQEAKTPARCKERRWYQCFQIRLKAVTKGIKSWLERSLSWINTTCASVFMTVFIYHKPSAFAFIVYLN